MGWGEAGRLEEKLEIILGVVCGDILLYIITNIYIMMHLLLWTSPVTRGRDRC